MLGLPRARRARVSCRPQRPRDPGGYRPREEIVPAGDPRWSGSLGGRVQVLQKEQGVVDAHLRVAYLRDGSSDNEVDQVVRAREPAGPLHPARDLHLEAAGLPAQAEAVEGHRLPIVMSSGVAQAWKACPICSHKGSPATRSWTMRITATLNGKNADAFSWGCVWFATLAVA